MGYKIFMIEHFLQKPLDTGPIYKETLMGRLPVEPFNTFSNLIFLCIIIYFSLKVYKEVKRHRFLSFGIPILAIGFVGGTIYHATRSHELWLVMDWLPIMILCLAVVVYFIFKLYTTWWQRLLMIILIIGSSFAIRFIPMPVGLRISLGYIITSVTVILPILLYLKKTKWINISSIALAVLCFCIAITFRSVDKIIDFSWLYMGTHWLWHLFGGVSVYFLMNYIYLDGERFSKINIK